MKKSAYRVCWRRFEAMDDLFSRACDTAVRCSSMPARSRKIDSLAHTRTRSLSNPGVNYPKTKQCVHQSGVPRSNYPAREQNVAKRIRKAKLFLFLRNRRKSRSKKFDGYKSSKHSAVVTFEKHFQISTALLKFLAFYLSA